MLLCTTCSSRPALLSANAAHCVDRSPPAAHSAVSKRFLSSHGTFFVRVVPVRISHSGNNAMSRAAARSHLNLPSNAPRNVPCDAPLTAPSRALPGPQRGGAAPARHRSWPRRAALSARCRRAPSGVRSRAQVRTVRALNSRYRKHRPAPRGRFETPPRVPSRDDKAQSPIHGTGGDAAALRRRSGARGAPAPLGAGRETHARSARPGLRRGARGGSERGGPGTRPTPLRKGSSVV